MQQPKQFADLPQDFLAFYQKFRSDSAYQMAHIEWPLKGEAAERVDSTTYKKVLKTWDPETWEISHMPDFNDPGLKRSFEAITDVLITEKLQYPMVNFGMERQFFKQENNEWQLIYYSEMQELR